jgi:hypothetical protein
MLFLLGCWHRPENTQQDRHVASKALLLIKHVTGNGYVATHYAGPLKLKELVFASQV